MKKNSQSDSYASQIPDIDIIDLDTEPIEKLTEAEQEDVISENDPCSEAVPEETDFSEADFSEEDFSKEDFSEADFCEEEALSEEDFSYDEAPFEEEDFSHDSYQTEAFSEETASDEELPELTEYEDEEADSHGRSRLHLLMFAVPVLIVLIFCFIGYRIWNYGIDVDINSYEGKDEREVLDNILPVMLEEGQSIEDDGITTIVAFGNAPFADDRDSEDSLANMIAEGADATVYNCSVPGSYLAAQGATLSSSIAPLDAFNFYWLTTAFCLRNNEHVYEDIFKTLGDEAPAGAREAYELLLSIDFNTVDVITLMYDGSDYLAGHNMYSDENSTDIQQFTGNMEAGIELIQKTYPHIRIIVLSPTYAYAVDENGNYVSSDQYRYNNQDVLSTYVIRQCMSSVQRSVTFVDNLYGTIHEDIASQYLTDNIHLNVEGRKLVADRFLYALNYYDKPADENK